jgi:predicted metal-dependent peptidase
VAPCPLLGALAAAFEVIEDRELCSRLDIRVAAVDAYEKHLYFNPLAGLSEQEARFVMAHEFLHVALRHRARVQGRHPYLWNVSSDYAINMWLVEMRIGDPPSLGLLLDHSLKGLSAESIYDRIVKDMRVMRRLDWFDAFFAPLETRRFCHRPSRRQSSPRHSRPRLVLAESALDGRTFGVALDTFGSMDRVTLARALGSVASYAIGREVPAVRIVFCDAAAYDAG